MAPLDLPQRRARRHPLKPHNQTPAFPSHQHLLQQSPIGGGPVPAHQLQLPLGPWPAALPGAPLRSTAAAEPRRASGRSATPSSREDAGARLLLSSGVGPGGGSGAKDLRTVWVLLDLLDMDLLGLLEKGVQVLVSDVRGVGALCFLIGYLGLLD